MSFLSGSSDAFANEKPKPLGIDSNKLSTNEQARPIPYFAGRRRIAATFISEVFDVKKNPVTRDIGKQKTRTGTSYFFSFAALLAHGPVDAIYQIILNGDIVWTGELLRSVSNPDYVDITIEDYGLIRIYWGTETQTRDDYLYYKGGAFTDTTPEHPPYRGIAYCVAHQLWAGFNQSNIQNLEFVVGRFPTIGSATAQIQYDANIAAVIFELLTNARLGRGLDESEIDSTAFEEVADQLATESLAASPLITSQEEAENIINELLEYIDGYAIESDGMLSIALTRSQSDLSSLPVVDESVLMEPVTTQAEDWSKTFNEVNVKFTDPDQAYEANVKTWRDRGNFAITGHLNTQTVERLFVTEPAVAEFMAKAIGRTRAIPECKGAARLRMTSLFDQLAPGSLFKLTYPPRGYDELVCRVTDRSIADPARPCYDIAFKIDRTYLTAGVTIDTPISPSEDTPITAASISSFRVVELPVGLSPDGKPTITVLASRPEATSAGYKTHLGSNYDETGEIAAESFEVINTHDRFAWHGKLVNAYAETEPLIDTETALHVLLDGPDTDLGEVDMFNAFADDMLVFINDEIFSVSNAEVVAENTYRLSVVRARFGTVKGNHAALDEVFIAMRSELQQIQHPIFQPFNAAVLKIQAFTGEAQTALEDITEEDVSIDGRVYIEPAPSGVTLNGTASGASYTTGQSAVIAWTPSDGGELPHRADLLARTFVVEFYNAAGDTLLGSTETPSPSLSLTNAELVALLGGSEVSFLVEVKMKTKSDWWELETDAASLAVTKI